MGEFEVEHGQKFRVLSPKEAWEKANPGELYRAPRIVGQGNTAMDRYKTVVNGKEYVDIFGDVVTASDNVAWPHGPNDSYRNVDYLQENIERFELIIEEE